MPFLQKKVVCLFAEENGRQKEKLMTKSKGCFRVLYILHNFQPSMADNIT